MPVSSSAELKLLGRRTSSNVQKVLWLLAELGQSCEQVDLGGPYGGNYSVDYLALNPNGRVPTLVHRDFVLWESNAICRYLSCLHDDGRLYPVEPHKRGICEQWMDWQLGTLQPVMVPLFVGLVRTPEEKRDHRQIAELTEQAAALFQMLDDALASSPYLVCERLTLADIANGIWTHRWFNLALTDLSMPHLRHWYSRLGLHPGYKMHVIDVPIA